MRGPAGPPLVIALFLMSLAATGCGNAVAVRPPAHHKASRHARTAPPPPPKDVSIAFDASRYAANGEFWVTCTIGALTGPCEVDSGSSFPFSVSSGYAQKAGLPTGSAILVAGGAGATHLYRTGANLIVGGIALGKSGGAIDPASLQPTISLGTLLAATGYAVSVNPSTHEIRTWTQKTEPSAAAPFYSGTIEGTVNGQKEPMGLDTGSPDGLFMSTSEAKALGIPLGAPQAIEGVGGAVVTGYTITATVKAGDLPPLTLHGYTSPDYAGSILLGTKWLEAAFSQGFVIDEDTSSIFALPPK